MILWQTNSELLSLQPANTVLIAGQTGGYGVYGGACEVNGNGN
jgi:hypothetical protein